MRGMMKGRMITKMRVARDLENPVNSASLGFLAIMHFIYSGSLNEFSVCLSFLVFLLLI
jgi:hypothetical protein